MSFGSASCTEGEVLLSASLRGSEGDANEEAEEDEEDEEEGDDALKCDACGRDAALGDTGATGPRDASARKASELSPRSSEYTPR